MAGREIGAIDRAVVPAVAELDRHRPCDNRDSTAGPAPAAKRAAPKPMRRKAKDAKKQFTHGNLLTPGSVGSQYCFDIARL